MCARRTLPSLSAATRTSSLAGRPFLRRMPHRPGRKGRAPRDPGEPCRHEAVQPCPRRLVRTEAHDALEVLCRDASPGASQISRTARNHILRGFLLFSSSVPSSGSSGDHNPHTGRKSRLAWGVPAVSQPTQAQLAAPAGLNPVGTAAFSVAKHASNSVAVFGKSRHRSSCVRCVIVQLLRWSPCRTKSPPELTG